MKPICLRRYKNSHIAPMPAAYTLLDLSAEIRQSDVVNNRVMSLLNVGIHARVSKGVMARCLGSV